MNKQFSFRPDIQVIRAAAVVLVIAYHLGIPGFGNGYLGVDIFFVVSGYLMQKLYDPAEGFLAFWQRRAARLLPAYFTVVLATMLAGPFVLQPEGLDRLAQQAMYAAGFASNIGFWQEESYFTGIYFSPLLHLWSLGVEIQYYLIVPFLSLALRRSRLFFLMLVVGSFACCLAALTISPKTSFFMMPLRFWEFGLGMLVAQWRGNRPVVPGWVSPLAFAGLVPLMSVPIDGTRQSVLLGHQSLVALAACGLTCLMLAGVLSERFIGSFAGRVAHRVGDLSYSLYLVHFPVLTMYGYVPFDGTNSHARTFFDGVVLLVVIAGAAFALFTLVERPGARIVKPARVVVASAVVVGIALVMVPLQLLSFSQYDRNVFNAGRDRSEFRCGKWARILDPAAAFCTLGATRAPRETVLLVGDSHSDAIKESFAAAAGTQDISVGFPVEYEVLRDGDLGSDWLIREARRLGVRRIFLHHSTKGLTAADDGGIIDALRDAGIGVTYILPMPIAEDSVPRLAYMARAMGVLPPTLPRASYLKLVQSYRDMLATKPWVGVVDPLPVACPEDCPLVADDGRPYYFDNNHLTLTGARRFEPMFEAALK